MSSNRFYWFFVRSYEPPEKFKSIFDHCKNYAYIYHNMDGKEPHYHYLFHLINNSTPSAFLNTYGIKMHSEPCYNPLSAFEYLTHKNDPDKYQYPFEDIVALDINKFQFLSLSGNEDNKNLRTYDLLQDIINKVPLQEMVYKYGRDFVLNYKKYRDFALMLSNSELMLNEEYLYLLSEMNDLKRLEKLRDFMKQSSIDL